MLSNAQRGEHLAKAMNLPPQTQAEKPTYEEIRLRVNIICEMLAEGRRPSEIRSACRRLWGVTRRTTDRYLKRARDELVRVTRKSREDLAADAVHWYFSIIQDRSNSLLARMKAREELNKMLGLYAQFRTEQPEDDDHDVLDLLVSQLSQEQLEQLDKIGAVLEAIDEQKREAVIRERRAALPRPSKQEDTEDAGVRRGDEEAGEQR